MTTILCFNAPTSHQIKQATRKMGCQPGDYRWPFSRSYWPRQTVELYCNKLLLIHVKKGFFRLAIFYKIGSHMIWWIYEQNIWTMKKQHLHVFYHCLWCHYNGFLEDVVYLSLEPLHTFDKLLFLFFHGGNVFLDVCGREPTALEALTLLMDGLKFLNQLVVLQQRFKQYSVCNSSDVTLDITIKLPLI